MNKTWIVPSGIVVLLALSAGSRLGLAQNPVTHPLSGIDSLVSSCALDWVVVPSGEMKDSPIAVVFVSNAVGCRGLDVEFSYPQDLNEIKLLLAAGKTSGEDFGGPKGNRALRILGRPISSVASLFRHKETRTKNPIAHRGAEPKTETPRLKESARGYTESGLELEAAPDPSTGVGSCMAMWCQGSQSYRFSEPATEVDQIRKLVVVFRGVSYEYMPRIRRNPAGSFSFRREDR